MHYAPEAIKKKDLAYRVRAMWSDLTLLFPKSKPMWHHNLLILQQW